MQARKQFMISLLFLGFFLIHSSRTGFTADDAVTSQAADSLSASTMRLVKLEQLHATGSSDQTAAIIAELKNHQQIVASLLKMHTPEANKAILNNTVPGLKDVLPEAAKPYMSISDAASKNITGYLRFHHTDSMSRSESPRYVYELASDSQDNQTPGEVYKLQFAGAPPSILPGSHVKVVAGVAYSPPATGVFSTASSTHNNSRKTIILANGGPSNLQNITGSYPSVPPPPTNLSILIVPITWPGAPSVIPPAGIQALKTQVTTYIPAVTYGKTHVTVATTPQFSFPTPANCYTWPSWFDVVPKAQRAGYNITNFHLYNIVLFAYPYSNACQGGYNGYGFVGYGDGITSTNGVNTIEASDIFGNWGLAGNAEVADHELGHNLYHWHDNTDHCVSDPLTCVAPEFSSEHIEYGHPYSVMGSNGNSAESSAVQRIGNSMITPNRVRRITGSHGTTVPIFITNLETNSNAVIAYVVGNVNKLMYAGNGLEPYSLVLSKRSQTGPDAFLPTHAVNGVMVEMGALGATGSFGDSENSYITTIASGTSQNFPDFGVRVTAGTVTSSGINATVTFTGASQPCTLNPPPIFVTPSTLALVEPGQSENFSVNITNLSTDCGQALMNIQPDAPWPAGIPSWTFSGPGVSYGQFLMNDNTSTTYTLRVNTSASIQPGIYHPQFTISNNANAALFTKFTANLLVANTLTIAYTNTVSGANEAVQVTVTAGGAPIPGASVTVVANNGSNHQISTATTNASGQITFNIPLWTGTTTMTFTASATTANHLATLHGIGSGSYVH